MKKIIFFLLAISALLFSCKTQPEGHFESSNLPGMIYDADNRPCDKVLITAYSIDEEGEEEFLLNIQSDIHGRFTIPDLERGSYRVVAEKKHHESISTVIFYSSRLDVLYLKIFSQKQILNKATKALDERRLGTVEDYLTRSENIDADEPYSLYLKSIFLYEKKLFDEALMPLLRIVEQGFRFPYVHLLLADIYQYELNEANQAVFHLEKYLNLIDDSEVNLRKKELEDNEIQI